MYDTILVPTDGSDHAVRAAAHARALARRFDATVHVLAVVDVPSAAGPLDAGSVDESFLDRLEAESDRHVDAITATFAETDPLRRAVRRGEPTAAILAYAAEVGADLLAMGTHGRSGITRYVAGSVTERVLRRAPAPVLTVRATEQSRETDYDEILVPTDGSEAATAAVEHALAVAERTGARVHAVNVVSLASVDVDPEYSVPSDLLDHLEARGEAATEAIAGRAREAGLEAVTAIRNGVPDRELLAYADSEGIDLIAMATAGRTGLSRFLLGSTAERVVRHAEVPVLAVNVRDRVESEE
ncbi:MAG: universal stress protein [Haloarculaceae archaeon]